MQKKIKIYFLARGQKGKIHRRGGPSILSLKKKKQKLDTHDLSVPGGGD